MKKATDPAKESSGAQTMAEAQPERNGKPPLAINPKFKQLIPPLAPEELRQLEENIKAEGCRDALVTWNETLLDGHNRFDICERNGLPFRTTAMEFADEDAACLWIIDNQFGRRNLAPLTRVELTERRKTYVKGRQGFRTDLTSAKNLAEVAPRDQLAAQAGVSKETYRAAKLVLDHANEDTKEKLRRNQISIHAVAKNIKEKLGRDKRRAERMEAAGDSPASKIIVGDFREHAGAVADGSLSLIFTDPPYDREASKMLPDLASFAAAKLCEGGSLVCYVGHTQLPSALDALRLHLRYWWTCACVHSGGFPLMREYGIRVGWKPMLWFVKETRDSKAEIVYDTISGGQEKTEHDWQQSESEAAYWIEKLCPPDGIVCDPFLGSGTTAAAAAKLNRQWIGFERDETSAKIASARIAGSQEDGE